MQIRKLRASGTEEDAAKADEVLHALLALKNRYKELTGEEHRSKASKVSGSGGAAGTKRGRDGEDAAGGPEQPSSSSAAAQQPRRAKQPKFVKPKKDEMEEVDPMTLPPGPETFPAWEEREFFRFEVLHESRKPGSRARVGRITTPHGVIETPCFVPVGTNAALKCLDERHARDAGVQLMFCNSKRATSDLRPPLCPQPPWDLPARAVSARAVSAPAGSAQPSPPEPAPLLSPPSPTVSSLCVRDAPPPSLLPCPLLPFSLPPARAPGEDHDGKTSERMVELPRLGHEGCLGLMRVRAWGMSGPVPVRIQEQNRTCLCDGTER